jgi:hypothetical protein
MCRVLVDGLWCTISNTSSSSCSLRLPQPARVCHGTACFSQITMHRFKYTSVRLSLIRISTLMFLRCSERISVAKTINVMHICKLRIRHFCCCYCYCYRYYCPSLITALQLSVPPSNELNNIKRHQHKNVVTRKRW